MLHRWNEAEEEKIPDGVYPYHQHDDNLLVEREKNQNPNHMKNLNYPQ